MIFTSLLLLNTPTAEQRGNIYKWLSEAYEEGRKNGGAFKGDAKRRSFLDGYEDGYKRGVEDAVTACKSLLCTPASSADSSPTAKKS